MLRKRRLEFFGCLLTLTNQWQQCFPLKDHYNHIFIFFHASPNFHLQSRFFQNIAVKKGFLLSQKSKYAFKLKTRANCSSLVELLKMEKTVENWKKSELFTILSFKMEISIKHIKKPLHNEKSYMKHNI